MCGLRQWNNFILHHGMYITDLLIVFSKTNAFITFLWVVCRDYISPSILKVELGIAAEMDNFDSNFKQEVLPTSTVLGKGLSILSAMGNTFQGLISNTDPPLSALKSASIKNGTMSYEDSPAATLP